MAPPDLATSTTRAGGATSTAPTLRTTKRTEVPRTLAEPVPQPLGLLDQLGLWGNLGVSLLGFTGAIWVLQPGGAGTAVLSVEAALTAIVVGTVLGTLAVAAAGVPGAATGSPAMVLLRGLLGARLSYIPTLLNVLQCVGWGTFELVTISTAAHLLAPGVPEWTFVLVGGAITTGLTMRPLGFVRVLRRYVTGTVAVVLLYLFVELVRHPLPAFAAGTWHGFWAATDTTVAVAISFAPLAADYTRHSRSPRTAFVGSLTGYTITQVACYVIGLVTLVTVAKSPTDIYAAFIAVPLGSVAFAFLALREIDQAFADVYSTAVSLQNLRPLTDRRILAALIGALSTGLALWFDIGDYQDFLLLIGSVFVPMFGVFVVDYFVVSRGHWDLSPTSPARWWMLVPWSAGFLVYQFINPGEISWWVRVWTDIDNAMGVHPASWMSASLCSFTVSGVATLAVNPGRKFACTAAQLLSRDATR
jgi:putative hydroxymethylpyrimidine transporter CytX